MFSSENIQNIYFPEHRERPHLGDGFFEGLLAVRITPVLYIKVAVFA